MPSQIEASEDPGSWDALLRERIAEILSQASRLGASAAKAQASMGRSLQVSARQGELENVEFEHDQSLSVSLYFGRQTGSASSTDGRPESIREMVEAAAAIARHIEEDPYSGLAEPTEMATHFPDLDIYHPWSLRFEEAEEIALAIEAAGRSLDKRITNSEGAWVSTREGGLAYGNSHGFIASRLGTSHSLGCTLIASQNGLMQRDYHYSQARSADSLEPAEFVGRLAAERALSRLDAQKAATACMPVLFDASNARGLLGHFLSAISGGNIYRKQSFLVDGLGKQVFPARYSIKESPYLPGAIGSSSYDGDGLQTRENCFVADGSLASYILSTYSGRQLDMPSTANAGGTHNVLITDDGLSFEELLAEMGDGFLVRELLGQGVNLVTGDYSRGAAGFLVRGGQIAEPVEGVTIAGNLAEMYRNIRAIGKDIDTRGNIRTGSILVGNMTLAGD